MDNYTELIAIQEELKRRKSRKRLLDYYPDTGPLRRELYPKHMLFFTQGATYRERGAICANRVGKTEGMGGYEITCHLTGVYPDWWPGKRFNHPIEAWASGKTVETTRDIIQNKLIGPPDKESEWGTGLIPGDLIMGHTRRRGVSNALDTVAVRHVPTGGVSVLGFKAYEQGRGKYEGTAKHVIWNDEEPPMDVYTEELMRTMTVDGIVMNTFTPLEGISEVVLLFMPGGNQPRPDQMQVRASVFADWNDVPHLSEKAKKELYDSLPVHEREARSKGTPSLGSGAIYPVEEDRITVADFIIPVHWPRCYAMDVGWNWTAAVWGAIDRDSQCTYLYSCYKQGKAEAAVHASAIRGRGDWIPGVIDPASGGSSQINGDKLLQLYLDERLDLTKADNAVEAGIYDVWTGLSTGKVKVFKSMAPWLEEFRLYRRDKNGKIVKVNDHLMDTTRYLYRSGRARAITKPLLMDPNMIVLDYASKPSAMCA